MEAIKNTKYKLLIRINLAKNGTRKNRNKSGTTRNNRNQSEKSLQTTWSHFVKLL